MTKSELKILCPNGHLGFAPSKEGSFALGKKQHPDYYCCDSGSDDIGPVPLGEDACASPYAWQVHDLEMMLLAAREQNVPMIIGSAGDTGSNSRVDMYVDIIKNLAQKHNLKPFKLAYFYSELPKAVLKAKMKAGIEIKGLDNRPALTEDELDATSRIVAVAGVHPFIKALEQGADVIIGGSCSDCAVFAAPAIFEGFPPDLSYYLGKVLECASFCAEPYGAKETVLGTITKEDVKVTAMHPDQRCSIASVAGHAMYERSNPYFEYVAGGLLDMTNCSYEQFDEKTCRITGPVFKPQHDPYLVKLEGSGKVGEMRVGIAGVRDPYSIKNIDKVLAWAREQVAEQMKGVDYELHFIVYGKNGVMGDMEPQKKITSHELCVVIKGVAPTAEQAELVATMGTRGIFYARLPEVKGTAGTAAYTVDEVLTARAAHRWTMNHVVPVKDPMELFELHYDQVGK
jgi:hypothetical protein